jgi:hypothetical protein
MCLGFYYKFYMFFYYKFILKEKFIKHNMVNYLCCDVKYFDLHLSLNFLKHLSIRLMFYFMIVYFFYHVVK